MRPTRKILALLLSLLLAWPPSVFAEAKTGFRLSSSEAAGKLRVTVTAANVEDLYAYDLRFAYDPVKWKPTGAASGVQGFDVFPSPKEGKLRFAYTQIGETTGRNGTVTLAVLTFERLSGGSSTIVLEQAKLVKSSLETTSFESRLALPLADGTSEFRDTGGHWAEKEIREAAKLGIVTGFADGTFRPGQPVTRAEFVVMLSRALKLQNGDVDGDADDLGFADRDAIPAWAKAHVQAAVRSKLAQGYEDGSFRASGKVTRLEMATMAVRALDRPAADIDAWRSFADAERIPAWGRAAAGAAAEAGLMNGKPGGKFAPAEPATRAETVVVLLKLLKLRA